MAARFVRAGLNMTCPSPTPEGPFISGTLDYIDCQAQIIGEAGYRALASPSSSFSPLLTLAMTIFVAIIGYRLLIGENLRGRDTILSAVKVGMALLLATSWPAFQTIAYNLVLKTPANLAQSIGEPAGIPGAGGGLTMRLQNVDNAMAELLVRGSGGPDIRLGQTAQTRWLSYDPIRSAATLEQSRTIYSVSSIAAFASVRLVAGILLAMGPIFALFFLFDGTRGLFEGWIRALVGTILAATTTAIILGVELALLEPLLSQILEYRRAGVGTPMAAFQLLIASLVFALVLLAALLVSMRVARGFRFPIALIEAAPRWAENYWTARNADTQFRANDPVAIDDRRRAQMVADVITITQRRDEAGAMREPIGTPSRAALISFKFSGGQDEMIPVRNSAARRRTVGRTSAGDFRRDAR
jgi:type IV secretion system protein VirB6